MNPTLPLLLLACLSLLLPARAPDAEIKDLSINGGLKDGKGRLVIDARLSDWPGDRAKTIVASTLLHSLRITREKHEHSVHATLRILQGDPRELPLALEGEGDILRVTGAELLDWSVRRETNGTRSLVLRPRRGEKPPAQLEVDITAERALRGWVNPVRPLTFAPPDAALGNGYVRIEATPDLTVTPTNTTGLVPLEPAFLPEAWRSTSPAEGRDPLAFRFHGSAYSLPLLVTLADPEAGRVVLRDFQLQGRLSGNTAAFTLTAQARVKDPRGGRLVLLGGGAALSELDTNTPGRLRVMDGHFILGFDQPGDYPVRLQFHAAVRQNAGWQSVDFKIAPSALQPITLSGLAADTQFEFAGAARPERSGSNFVSFLPPDGRVKLAWKEARAEAEGRLFYAANLLSQITISPGLMRQVAVVEARVMQGELSRLSLEVRGPGSVTAVQGPSVLAWNLEPGANASAPRRLVVQFNQPQKESATLQVSMQTELGAFPQAIEAMQVRPEGATRLAGHLRVVNEGAVRLEVTQAPGLSQISPEQFPQSDLTKSLPPATAAQRFAFRFSSADFALRINADNILPEVGVSELLGYHLGETELAIDADLELDIREAPLRELLLRVPRGYAVARLQAAGLADYFLREPAGQPDAELRLVYGQPVTGRQIVQLRLERNGALGQPTWTLPRVEVLKAKSTRGHVAVSADPGFRLTPDRTSGLTDIATAFYPRKVANIQAAFRLADPLWEAALRVDRLPQSIQADVLHLFSIGEGIAYGSSTMNFFISGAPVSAFLVALSEEYFNVEFTGKDLRSNWQKTTNGYLVSLNAPVSGAYTLLVTYERPFKAQGDTLAFTGARPLDAQTEQGHTLVVSAYQFEVSPAAVSPGLLELQTAEVPSEYRLFFDAPILKAYRYTARPFNLQLGLRPLEQGSTLGLVVDRAAFRTRVSKDGEVVTDAKYYVKNRGNPHFRLNLPAGTTLWSATVNGNTTVPVLDGATHLIPLPQRTDPNAVQELDLKLASRSANAGRVTAAAPIVAAPVLLAEWQVDPDTGQVLSYRGGSLTPADGVVDASGFAGLVRQARRGNLTLGLMGAALAVFAAWAWRWAAGARTHRFSLRHVGGTLVGLGAFALASLLLTGIVEAAWQDRPAIPPGLTFRAPVQQAGSALTLDLGNSRDEWTAGRIAGLAWPALLGLAFWAYAGLRKPGLRRTLDASAGWTLLAWAALRWPHGAGLFLGLLSAFLLLHLLLPAARPLFRLPPRPTSPPSPATPAVTALLLLGGWLACTTLPAPAATTESPLGKPALIADRVLQEVRVENQFIFVTARIRWQAGKDQLLPLIQEPAVVTGVDLPPALQLVQATAGGKRQHQALALRDGAHDLTVRYQLQVGAAESTQGFTLPTQPGLVNRLTLTLAGMDADVTCAAAVAVTRVEAPAKAGPADTNAVFQIVLAPSTNVWVGWKPRARDVRRERAVFFAEWNQLYVPAAGVLEGAHLLQVRPAQGELSELVLDVPPGATITDVIESGPMAQVREERLARPSVVSLWRFDPDARKLRVSLTPAQSRAFAVLIRSQMATGPLPLEQTAGLLTVQQAAGQVGALGLATGDEVQLESAAAQGLSPINLEDFPPATVEALRPQIPGLTVRRAFRYTEAKGSVSLKAAAVEPDVRVDTEQTLSLGEDRTVLAAKVDVTVTRAGVFRLSFLLATNLDVETLTGPALSHWTELRTPEGRIITLHLKGRTEGAQTFQLALAGPGTRSMTNYVVPRLSFREAAKQRGQLTLVPEQGLRLQVTSRDGVTQLDPQKSGLRQKGLLAFRLLQAEWSLVLEVEQVDAWVQVTSLQHLSLSEAMLKVTANLQYQIENTGLKSLRIRVPTNAEGVRFRGEQVADFLPVPGSITNGLQAWEVKLHRRVIGRHLFQAVWQTPLAAGATNVLARGVQAEDANLQRGFVTVQSGGRLQVRADAPPAALQPAEWQSIPRALLQDIPAPAASHTFRLVEAAFQLPLTLERHGATRLLDARVQDATLTSVISDEGVMLTQLKLRLVPGDKRLLRFSLPPEAGFWFAFVNQNGVWPWREQGRILIPLEQQSRGDQPVTVEIFYSSRIGSPGTRRLDLSLSGPKLDLPLENITWQVYLNEKWHLSKWSGTLQLEEQSTVVPLATAAGVQGYLQNELVLNQRKTKVAEEMLSLGNRLLEQGNPQQARRAFQSAYGLSTHDQAFNEDARVQLQNLKLQQALIGLNVNQSAVGGETAPGPDNVRQLRGRKDNAYTQQEAKQIMEGNDASDNAALLRIAERLVQQQDAAVTAPAAIRATVPEQGRLLTFRRTVQVDTEADLRLQLAATARQAASPLARFAMLAGVFVGLALLAWFGARAAGPATRA